MKLVFASLLIVSVVLTTSFLQTTMAQADKGYDCDSACSERCKLAGVKDRCLFYCGVCCKRCQCVAPGTNGYGNESDCPCYRNMLNSKRQHKCP